MKAQFAWMVIALLFSYAGHADTVTNAIDPDMAEAVFRYQFLHNASGQQTNAAAYFIAIADKDPDDAFMRRFKGHQPPVKKRSQCSTVGMRVTDKETQSRGLIFTVDRIVVKDEDRAEASGGYYEGGLSASGNTYYLKRVNGKWFVEKDAMHWISQKSRKKRIDSYVSNRGVCVLAQQTLCQTPEVGWHCRMGQTSRCGRNGCNCICEINLYT